MTRDTSLKAYLNEISPTLGSRQILVMEVFEREPERDFTNGELCQLLEWDINRITPRVFELREMKLLVESVKRKCGRTGREVQAWKLTGAMPSRAIAHAPTRYQLPSMTERRKTHMLKVAQGIATCDCKGYLFRGRCSHIQKLKAIDPTSAITPML